MRSVHLLAASSLAATGLLTSLAAPTGAAAADGQDKPGHTAFAVIGDVPYGADQVARFPAWVSQINADPDVDLAVHVGDIKNGSSRCDDGYLSLIRGQFDRFEDPLVYTPGDNEWTDCHRTNNGGYNPLERLDVVRETFFDRPGTTLGDRPVRVASQAAVGLPENVWLRRDRLAVGAVHVVGSNNGRKPWSGLGLTEPTPEQLAEEQHRMQSSIALVRQLFADAARRQDRAVVVFLQADMFDPTYTPAPDDISAFRPLVQALAEETNRFGGPVYLFDGDSHVYNVDRPLAPGSVWLERYGVSAPAPALQRVTVDGSTNNTDWLKVSVHRPGADTVLSWEQVPYTD